MSTQNEGQPALAMGAPEGSDLLKMAGIHGGGRRFPEQGVVVNLSAGAQNRAQRRLMSRVQRRAAGKARP